MEEEDLGFEYLNSKEKCLVEQEDGTYGMECSKPHAHHREVSVQGRGPTAEIRSAGRAMQHALHECTLLANQAPLAPNVHLPNMD